jgi:hypothetical protein
MEIRSSERWIFWLEKRGRVDAVERESLKRRIEAL